MKLLVILFVFMAFSVAKILVLNEAAEQPEIVFPTFDNPNISFIDVSDGCGAFVDCIEYLGAIIFNIGAGIIYVVLVIVELITYLIEFFGLILAVQFEGIEGAPFWVNLLLSFPFLAALAIIFFKLFRSGESAA